MDAPPTHAVAGLIALHVYAFLIQALIGAVILSWWAIGFLVTKAIQRKG